MTDILWNLQPEKFQLRKTRTGFCKPVTWSGKISTVSYNARITGIKRAFQRIDFEETRAISVFHSTYLRCLGMLWVLQVDISSRTTRFSQSPSGSLFIKYKYLAQSITGTEVSKFLIEFDSLKKVSTLYFSPSLGFWFPVIAGDSGQME